MESKHTKLTRREQQVIALAAQDLSDKMTADVLGCSRRTITKHWESIFRKTGTHSRCGAVTMFLAACLNGEVEKLLGDISKS